MDCNVDVKVVNLEGMRPWVICGRPVLGQQPPGKVGGQYDGRWTQVKLAGEIVLLPNYGRCLKRLMHSCIARQC